MQRGVAAARGLIVCLGAVAILLGACDGDDPEARRSLEQGIEWLRETDGITYRLSLITTPQSIKAIAADEGNKTLARYADVVQIPSITWTYVEFRNPERFSTETIISLAGFEVLEWRSIANDAYIRADVRRLLETFGGDFQVLEAFVEVANRRGFDFVRPTVDGEWVGLSGLPPRWAEQEARKQSVGIPALAGILESGLEIHSEGTDELGTHLLVDTTLQRLLERIRLLLQPLGGATGRIPPLTMIPDEAVELDVWISEGRLSRIELDLLHHADRFEAEVPEGVNRLTVRLDLQEFSGSVAEPPTATTVPIRRFFGFFFGALRGFQ
jgi:hypothetical protein